MPNPQKNEIVIRIPRPSGRGTLKLLPRTIGFGATVALAVVAVHQGTDIQWLEGELPHVLMGSGIAAFVSFWLREIMDSRR